MCRSPRAEARARLGISDDTLVLGLFGAMHYPGSRELGAGRGGIAAPFRAGCPGSVFGRAGAIAARKPGAIPSLAEGPLPGDEISRRLAAVDIYLTPLVDGISTRRTTLTAGLQHGLPIVGMKGHSTDEMLLQQDGHAFLLADVSRPAEFTAHVRRLVDQPDLRRTLGEAARRLYEQHFTWARISDSLLTALGATAPADNGGLAVSRNLL